MKHHLKFLTLICIFIFFSSGLFAYESGDFILVIDPGHGGKDYGAPGAKSREKNINLNVALLFGELVMAKHPDVKVIFTRKTDRFVELKERAELANREKADLFVSIHSNASVSRAPYGAETFTLGLAKTEENLEVAKRENSVILLEENYERKYEGFDPKSSESYIIFEFIQNKHMEQSVSFASMIQNEFKNSSKRSDRGVKQAGFLVLRETSMPSVLVELGFISNPAEEAYMSSAIGRQSLANSLYNAFTRYKAEHDRKTGGNYYAPLQSEPTNSAVPTTPTPQPATVQKTNEEINHTLQVPSSGTTVSPALAPAPAPAPTPPQQKTVQPPKANVATKPTAVPARKGEIVYKIQILASSTPLPPNAPQLKGYRTSSYRDTDGFYKYTFGDTTSAEEINRIKANLKKDFPDAFTVRFVDGKRIK